PYYSQNYAIDGPAIYPEYLTDPKALICPSDSDAGEAETYIQDLLTALQGPGPYVLPIEGFTTTREGLVASITDDFSYAYMGFAYSDAAEAVGAIAISRTLVEGGNGALNFDEDLDASSFAGVVIGGVDLGRSGLGGGSTIYRLREGIERFAITDINNPAASAQAQSSIVVMCDVFAAVEASAPSFTKPGVTKFNHIPGGANFLYMDGHVSFHRYQPASGDYLPGGALELLDYGAFPCYAYFARELGGSQSGEVGGTVHQAP
ncbi:MAG: hypothetical protein GWP08_13220, partial [Nitrospiraceae bacterium]|nr:hypothetical protein [Nitrospiraceae bacterium]